MTARILSTLRIVMLASVLLGAGAIAPGVATPGAERPPTPPDWFHVVAIDEHTFALSEPEYWQQNVSYLLIGSKRALLFDTGPGLYSIRAVVRTLTPLPVIVIPSHLHFDHVGDLDEFDDVRLPDEPRYRAQVQEGFFVEPPSQYMLRSSFKFRVHGWIRDGEFLDLGGRRVQAIRTPGHTKDSVSLIEVERRRLYIGDLVNRSIVLCAVPGSDVHELAASLHRLLESIPSDSVAYEAHAEPPLTHSELASLRDGIEQIAAGHSQSTPACLGGTPMRRFMVGAIPVVLPLAGGPAQAPLASVTATIDWDAGPCP